MKKLLLLAFTFTLSIGLNAQDSIEDQVADTACACLSKIDTTTINSSTNGLKMICLQEAMIKNQESIIKVYETEMRREEDEAKLGLRGSLMIKVQNVLAVRCRVYQLIEQKVQAGRQAGRKGQVKTN